MKTEELAPVRNALELLYTESEVSKTSGLTVLIKSSHALSISQALALRYFHSSQGRRRG